ncbi:tripartite tricarboxylate transporter TctB family protein [Polynucleobacter sp. UK-Mo-2m-Kol15]|uniref:tripartite tricarboxylate transporter TctB family protein n=1 Tax=Polynucleobacter sp. UK-Mo-2m-Kol15 TaxID=2576916 RepID=UPI001C0D5BD2|nr:tripartite tricarboxylate transporter TctB family protein [Polynucleobacter sp. UK-Mo-2m-Kol15]MBU3575117.1 tripartite tricarboxylate transporter TctB family protein [Polynucleobacter sp. UK-Mo-2m-Kol15]
MLKKIDFGFALLTFILGIYVVVEGFSYGFTAADGQPGSGLFPIIVGFALIFFSAINLLRSRIDYLSIKEEFSLLVTKRTLVILLGNGLIISLMSFFGIMLSTIFSILFTGLMIAWGAIDKRFVIQITVIAVVSTLVLHALFIKVLRIQPLIGIFGF